MHIEEQTVCILMGTYNGEKYISDQLNSLLSQSYVDWKLFVRDDGSADKTVALINEFAAKDSRITLVDDEDGNLGSTQNFARLIALTQHLFQYYMFCDQDDVWLSSKISDSLFYLKELEERTGVEIPLLVYTNFRYVDVNLQIIESKKNYHATKVHNIGFNHLLAQNPIYGCTMMMNKPLLELVKTIPKDAENHDFWVALVASALGEILYYKKPTILYRQHNNNISTNYDNSSFIKRFKRIALEREILADVDAKFKMAEAFRSIYGTMLSDKNKTILNNFICLGRSKSIMLFIKNIRSSVRRQTTGQTLLFYLGILLRKHSN